MKKNIVFHGQSQVLACDGRCDKAWGISNRPRLYFMGDAEPRALKQGEEPLDEDDDVFIGDDHLGTAPADPGTYEGDCGKPSAVPLENPKLMNKWCVRECERSKIFEPYEPITMRDMQRPRPNIPKEPVR